MRRAGWVWGIGMLAVLGAGAATVSALDARVYSASGFVDTYLAALERGDAATAVELAGMEWGDDAVLATADLLGTVVDAEVVGDDAQDDGSHLVTVRSTLAGEESTSTFHVEPDGSTLGVFTRWRFAEAPVATIDLTVVNDARFTANEVELVGVADAAVPYRVLVPSVVTFAHETRFLEAPPTTVRASTVGQPVEATLSVEANDAFVRTVQDELRKYLVETCTTQRVLLPANCPFGQEIDNRVVSEPEWSVVEYPDVALSPGGEAGTWVMPQTPGTAHLVVEVQSLFDGTVTEFDEDVWYDVGVTVSFRDDGGLYIRVDN